MSPMELPEGADQDETPEAMMYDGWGFVPLSEANAPKPAKSSEEHNEAA